ncbi:SH3 domain-containing protein [Helicobacter cetorum]|uniref:Periplasmic protein n=1 Tax=Helicobacter cetorum (strain ATCC BAA-429 / MIT 00-7128) TaxID=182217 RepID=I0EKL1_HELC0|nr:SH3 domain-containing protein [Helicobacter cetorum]AFI03480.1 hypothetical protein HCW_00935 [Helicobacter cetorum MIT 00-7128]
MRIIWLLLALCVGFVNAEVLDEKDEDVKAKVVYVKAENLDALENTPAYVGQTIAVTYSLLLFDAQFLEAKLEGEVDKDQIELLNKVPTWRGVEKELFKAVYYYKIKGVKASIPALKVSAFSNKDKYIDYSLAPSISLQVSDLSQNPRYAGVMAQDLDVVQYKTKDYDSEHNILVIEMAFKRANWEKFSIKEAIKQGFDNASIAQSKTKEGSVIYYCVLPKKIQSLSFDYFSLKEQRFKTLHFSVVPINDAINVQSELVPKNNFLVFFNVALLVLCVFFLLLFLLFGRKIIFLLLGILCLGFALYNLLFQQRSATLLAQKEIRILPTKNSTILGISKAQMPIKIIGSHKDYYKIMTTHEQIGWVKRHDIK